MKGVIVQLGHPKSIVLFNNGKIRAIPTPANCHVGMVVTVKFNNLFKIIIITLAAVILIALGIFIGVKYLGGTADVHHNEHWPGGRGFRRIMELEDAEDRSPDGFWPGLGRRRQMMEQGQ